MREALRIAQLIANAYPERMRLLFQANGISAPVSAQSIMDAYIVLGEPFLHQVFEIIWADMKNNSQFSNATGDPLDTSGDWNPDAVNQVGQNYADQAAALADAQTKTSFWDGLKNVFNTGGDILSGVANAYNTISGILGTNKVDTGTTNQTDAQAQLQAAMLQYQLEQQKAQSADKTKTFLLIGAGVLVAVLVLVMFLKK